MRTAPILTQTNREPKRRTPFRRIPAEKQRVALSVIGPENLHFGHISEDIDLYLSPEFLAPQISRRRSISNVSKTLSSWTHLPIWAMRLARSVSHAVVIGTPFNRCSFSEASA